MTDTRKIVLDILTEYEKEGTMLGPLLNDTLKKYAYLEERDRAFMKTLAEGVTERRMALDYVLDLASSVKTEKMKPMVRRILRMGTCQILYMDHVPDRAAVSESLRLMKIKHIDGLKGFANAVLRKVASIRDQGIVFPDMETEYSCPYWIAEKLRKDIGDERAEGVIKAMTGHPPMYLRVNGASYEKDDVVGALELEGIRTEDIPGSEALRVTEGSLNPGTSEAFIKGMYSVQDLSSQMAVRDLWGNYVNQCPDNSVDINAVDLCAAPGGKSCALAEYMKDRGQVKAFDISESRVDMIRDNTSRLGLSNVSCKAADASVLQEELTDSAHIIIADLPCTGLGVMRRKVDIKYRVRPKDVGELCKLQRLILDNAFRYLKQGGLMLFSVCTLTHEETVGQREYLESLGMRTLSERLVSQGTEDHDGFYHAVMMKT